MVVYTDLLKMFCQIVLVTGLCVGIVYFIIWLIHKTKKPEKFIQPEKFLNQTSNTLTVKTYKYTDSNSVDMFQYTFDNDLSQPIVLNGTGLFTFLPFSNQGNSVYAPFTWSRTPLSTNLVLSYNLLGTTETTLGMFQAQQNVCNPDYSPPTPCLNIPGIQATSVASLTYNYLTDTLSLKYGNPASMFPTIDMVGQQLPWIVGFADKSVNCGDVPYTKVTPSILNNWMNPSLSGFGFGKSIDLSAISNVLTLGQDLDKGTVSPVSRSPFLSNTLTFKWNPVIGGTSQWVLSDDGEGCLFFSSTGFGTDASPLPLVNPQPGVNTPNIGNIDGLDGGLLFVLDYSDSTFVVANNVSATSNGIRLQIQPIDIPPNGPVPNIYNYSFGSISRNIDFTTVNNQFFVDLLNVFMPAGFNQGVNINFPLPETLDRYNSQLFISRYPYAPQVSTSATQNSNMFGVQSCGRKSDCGNDAYCLINSGTGDNMFNVCYKSSSYISSDIESPNNFYYIFGVNNMGNNLLPYLNFSDGPYCQNDTECGVNNYCSNFDSTCHPLPTALDSQVSLNTFRTGGSNSGCNLTTQASCEARPQWRNTNNLNLLSLNSYASEICDDSDSTSSPGCPFTQKSACCQSSPANLPVVSSSTSGLNSGFNGGYTYSSDISFTSVLHNNLHNIRTNMNTMWGNWVCTGCSMGGSQSSQLIPTVESGYPTAVTGTTYLKPSSYSYYDNNIVGNQTGGWNDIGWTTAPLPYFTLYEQYLPGSTYQHTQHTLPPGMPGSSYPPSQPLADVSDAVPINYSFENIGAIMNEYVNELFNPSNPNFYSPTNPMGRPVISSHQVSSPITINGTPLITSSNTFFTILTISQLSATALLPYIGYLVTSNTSGVIIPPGTTVTGVDTAGGIWFDNVVSFPTTTGSNTFTVTFTQINDSPTQIDIWMKSLGQPYWQQALQLWDLAQVEENLCPDQITTDANNNISFVQKLIQDNSIGGQILRKYQCGPFP